MQFGIRTYLKSILLRKNPPERKFVIFGQPRTGSTLLVSALNSHPDIHCDGELLQQRMLFPRQFIESRAALSGKKVYGFKLLVYQLISIQKFGDPKEFLHDLNEQGYLFFCLKRRNIFRKQISNLYAYTTGVYHHRKTEASTGRIKTRLDPKQLFDWMEEAERQSILEPVLLNGISRLEFIYEDHLETQAALQATVDKITDAMDLERMQVETDLVKATPRDLSLLVENYSEIIEAIGQTRFASFIET